MNHSYEESQVETTNTTNQKNSSKVKSSVSPEKKFMQCSSNSNIKTSLQELQHDLKSPLSTINTVLGTDNPSEKMLRNASLAVNQINTMIDDCILKLINE